MHWIMLALIVLLVLSWWHRPPFKSLMTTIRCWHCGGDMEVMSPQANTMYWCATCSSKIFGPEKDDGNNS